MKKIKTIFLLALVGIATILISCDKEKEKTHPSPQPTVVSSQALDAGYRLAPLNINDLYFKVNNWWTDNGIQIQWSATQYGVSPSGPIIIPNGNSTQLTYVFLDAQVEGGFVQWYTNDQQIANVNWEGELTAQWIGTWFPGYPNIVAIYLYYYRPNPKYNPDKPNSKKWLDPYVDNVIVQVTP